MAELKDKLVSLEDLKAGLDTVMAAGAGNEVSLDFEEIECPKTLQEIASLNDGSYHCLYNSSDYTIQWIPNIKENGETLKGNTEDIFIIKQGLLVSITFHSYDGYLTYNDGPSDKEFGPANYKMLGFVSVVRDGRSEADHTDSLTVKLIYNETRLAKGMHYDYSFV